MSKSLGERFWEKVDCAGPTQPHMDTCCWQWIAGKELDGYGMFNVGIENGGKTRRAHVVSLSFVLSRMPAYVMHVCDNPACIRPSHLKEGTHVENVADRVRKNRSAKGEKQAKAKLKEVDVKVIRARRSRGEKCALIAKDFGVTAETVGHIYSRRTWKHVE